MSFALRSRARFACGLLLALAFARPVRADAPFFSIVAVQRSSGWHIEFDGDTEPGLMPSATLTPPGRSPIALTCESSTREDWCYRTDPPLGEPGFASLAALLAAYPNGSYGLSIGGGVLTAQLGFEPLEPDGSIDVTSPPDGAVGVAGQPTILYTHDCDTCGFLFFEIEGFDATAGVSLEVTHIGTPPFPASGSIPYGAFESLDGPKPTTLPDGSYRLAAAAGRGALIEATFEEGGEFSYGTGAERVTTSEFSVPEPSGSLAGAASLAALGARARRRRRRRDEFDFHFR